MGAVVPAPIRFTTAGGAFPLDAVLEMVMVPLAVPVAAGSKLT